MRKRHIFGFFDAVLRSPAFVFLCAMFLCGALAGGLTGLAADEGTDAVYLAALLAGLPAQVGKSVLCAVLWVALPLACVLLRPASLFLSAIAAARGFVLALTVAVGAGQTEGLLLSLLATGLPAVLSVPALLAACAMLWQEGAAPGRLTLRGCRAPYAVCVALAAASALLRAGFAALWSV